MGLSICPYFTKVENRKSVTEEGSRYQFLSNRAELLYVSDYNLTFLAVTSLDNTVCVCRNYPGDISLAELTLNLEINTPIL